MFEKISSCPDCGSPIWIDLADKSEANPPQHRFSCECRFVDKNEDLYSPYYPYVDTTDRFPPWTIHYEPVPYSPAGVYRPTTIPWTTSGYGDIGTYSNNDHTISFSIGNLSEDCPVLIPSVF